MSNWWWLTLVVGMALAFWLGTKVPTALMLIHYFRHGAGR